MSLDATAREANVRDSIKKYFYDNIKLAEGISVMFDQSLSAPKVQGNSVDRWVTIRFGYMDLDSLAEVNIEILPCTRKDNEGFKLAQLRDKIVNLLIESDTSKTDTMKRITLYQSRADGAWTNIGGLVVQNFSESREIIAPDETKLKIINVRLRWGAKV